MEAKAVTADSGTSVDKGARTASDGKGWSYNVVVPPKPARCEFGFKATGSPNVSVTTADGAALSSRSEKGDDSDSVRIIVDTSQVLGDQLRLRFDASKGPIAVRQVRCDLWLPDGNGNGLSDHVESLMGTSPGEQISIVPRPSIPHTGFFFAQPYDATMAVPTDVVQLYNTSVSPDPSMYSTWSEKGYGIQTFLHSRYPPPDGREDPAEYQTDHNGRPLVVIDVTRNGKRIDLSVGALTPEIKAAMIKRHGEDIMVTAVDHYKIPTQARIEAAQRCNSAGLALGAQGVCFDEPEIWADEGYSEAFKQAWQAKYGSAWQPPHKSVDARYQGEQLKAFLLERWVKSTLENAQQLKPSATRMMAMHSPTNYYRGRMSTPHHRLISMPTVQEVVAEVWNDPFDVSYLEYSSFYHLIRGTNKRLWFMLDPWGDSPAESLEFYRRSYGDNLVAALMFPQIDTYEPLIWPDRLYGHLPKEYEILINTVAGALSEMWRYPDGRVEAGSPGIATFIADSMGWQRAEPSFSDFDGFDGLTLPLMQRGVPVEALSLDRAAEPGYLDGAKCLLVSYDFLKPMDASFNRAIADWTRRGGTLVCFGGTDAYNAVAESWWKRAGHASPVEDLFAQMGLQIGDAKVLGERGKEIVLSPVDKTLETAPTDLRVVLGPTPGNEPKRSDSASGKVVRHYPVTLYSPPSGASPLYRTADQSTPVAWEAGVGKGRAIFVGVAPGYLRTSAQGPAWIRALAKYALEKAGGTYREQPYFLAHRGPYTAIRALGQAHTAPGRFVDLLSPTLAVLNDPVIAPNECAFLTDAKQTPGIPRVLATSGRLRAYSEGDRKTSLLVQAPTQTNGLARVAANANRLKGVKAFTTLGASVEVTSQLEEDTLLLRYPNDADGVVLRMEWEPKKSSE